VRDEFQGGVGAIVAAANRMVAAVRAMEAHRQRVYGLRCELANLEGTPQPVRAEPVTPGQLGVDRDHLPWLRVASAVAGKDRQTALHMVAELLAYLPQSDHSASRAVRDLTQEDLRTMPTAHPGEVPPVGPGRSSGLPAAANV
jgi:hypothetical protein